MAELTGPQRPRWCSVVKQRKCHQRASLSGRGAAQTPPSLVCSWRGALLLLVVLLLQQPLGGQADGSDQGAAPNAAGFPTGVGRPMFVLLGDSLTEMGFDEGGWGLGLIQQYNRRADIVNRGFSGYNTRMAMYVLDEVLDAFNGGKRIKLATLFYGANDAVDPNSGSAWMSVPLEEYVANLRAMVFKLRWRGVNQIVICTPPPVNDAKAGGQRNLVRTAQYATAAMDLAKELKLPYLDVFGGITAIPNWRNAALWPDGLHLTAAGHDAIYTRLLDTIGKAYPALQPSSLVKHMPDFRLINAANPGLTFNALYGYKVTTGVVLPQAKADSGDETAGAPPAQKPAPRPATAAAVVGNPAAPGAQSWMSPAAVTAPALPPGGGGRAPVPAESKPASAPAAGKPAQVRPPVGNSVAKPSAGWGGAARAPPTAAPDKAGAGAGSAGKAAAAPRPGAAPLVTEGAVSG